MLSCRMTDDTLIVCPPYENNAAQTLVYTYMHIAINSIIDNGIHDTGQHISRDEQESAI